MPFIYRVEKNGRGPYNNPNDEEFAWHLGVAHSWDNLHFPPYMDGIDDFGGEWFSGFSSMNQFRTWFDPEWQKELRDHGYQLNIYTANPRDIQVGRHQVAFKKNAPGSKLFETVMPEDW
jgi:hypothetical protein